MMRKTAVIKLHPRNPLFLIIVLVLAGAQATLADPPVPPLVNYQGTLTDENGAAIPDSMKKLEFNVYDAALGGNRVWGPQTFDVVPIINGRFNVILGTTDSAGRSIADAFGVGPRYLGFKAAAAAADLSGVAEISPRQQVLSAPFALRALHGVPVGSIMAYFGTLAPDGWVLCDGRPLTDPSLEDPKYSALKAHLASLGGTVIPDLRGRVMVGPDTMGQGTANRVIKPDGRSLGQAGGEETHRLTVGEMPSHAHSYGDIFYSEYNGPIAVPSNMGNSQPFDRDNGGYEVGRTTGSSGGEGSHNNMPPYMIVTHIIKY